MKRLPITDKNGFLSIYIAPGRIYSSLVYSHYDIGRKYTLSDITQIFPYDELGSTEFWTDFITELEKEFEWELVDSSKGRSPVGRVVPFQDEGRGVSAIKVAISTGHPRRGEIINALHIFLPEVKIVSYELETLTGQYSALGKKLGYKDVIYLNLDIEAFDIFRMIGDSGRYEHGKIHWDSKVSMVETLRDSRIKAFATLDYENSRVYNLWANFLHTEYQQIQLPLLRDVLRSYTTLQLLSISNNKPALNESFGVIGVASAIFLTGEVAKMMPDNLLRLAVLDGLQLRGEFDLIVDRSGTTLTLGHNLAEGINDPYFIASVDQVVPGMVKFYVPEVPGREGDRNSVFTAEILSKDGGRQDLYALNSEVLKIKLPKGERAVMSGRFLKGAYVEGMPQEQFTLLSDPEKIFYEEVFVDTRFKPVVYGPDFNANVAKLNRWLND